MPPTPEEGTDTPVLDLHVLVRSPTWTLRTESGSCPRAVHGFNCRAISTALGMVIFNTILNFEKMIAEMRRPRIFLSANLGSKAR